ncbi:hypothetical protein BDV25DRAFT_162254 [Aspergillus avenaceus]|uniref:Uncharacterized protein n=1 Tax=Aspergillus avenaceus TaxID=36643 RepID=A0A5N6TJI7_ASPAV|nr:hypothetical protein BDV25DRAFT_162254 [Aspergillus avenaceus]
MNPRNQLPQNIYKDSEDNLHPHLTVLHDLFTNKIYSPEAATKFASAALALDGSLSAQLGQLWHLILQIACQSPEHHDKLVDILADLSHLPDATKPSDDGQDEPLIIYDMQVWKDLPMLGWEIRRHWNYSIPAPGTTTNRERGAAISAMESVNRFVALLVATDEPGFCRYSWYALVTLRRRLRRLGCICGPKTPWRRGFLLRRLGLRFWARRSMSGMRCLRLDLWLGRRGRGGCCGGGNMGFVRRDGGFGGRGLGRL